MLPNYDDFLIKRFEQPDEVRTFEKGKFETVKIGSMTIGRASYEPGWKWSEHMGAATGAAFCEVEHVGLVVSGCAACQMKDGRCYEMRAGRSRQTARRGLRRSRHPADHADRVLV